MILIKDKEKIHSVYIPKNVFEPLQLLYKMHLFGQTNNKEYIITLADEKNLGDYYYFSLDLHNFENQEYKYEIRPIKDIYNEHNETWETYEDCAVSTGLLRIGNLDYNPKHFENSTAEIFYEEDKYNDNIKYYE